MGGQHVWSLVDCEQDSRAEISPLIEVTLNRFFWEQFHSHTAGVCKRPHTPCAALILTYYDVIHASVPKGNSQPILFQCLPKTVNCFASARAAGEKEENARRSRREVKEVAS